MIKERERESHIGGGWDLSTRDVSVAAVRGWMISRLPWFASRSYSSSCPASRPATYSCPAEQPFESSAAVQDSSWLDTDGLSPGGTASASFQGSGSMRQLCRLAAFPETGGEKGQVKGEGTHSLRRG